MSEKKTFPKLDQVLLAEQFREEAHNKVTLIGLYPGGSIFLHPKPGQTEGFALQSLGIMARFVDGNGTFQTRVELVPPNPDLAPAGGDLGQTEVKPGVPSVLGMSFVPFPVPSLGEYTLRVWLDDRSYEHRFLVKVADP